MEPLLFLLGSEGLGCGAILSEIPNLKTDWTA
jgi:hypothetical protein